MKDRTKILFVILSMAGGGAERTAALLLNKIDRKKFLPKLVIFKKEGSYLEDVAGDVEVIDLKKRGRLDFFRLIFKLRSVMKSENPDAVFSLTDYPNIVMVLASMLVKKKFKTIISERNNHRGYLNAMRFKFIRKALVAFTYKRADSIVVISEGIKKALVEDFSLEPAKIKVIYNPFDIEKIKDLSRQNVRHPFFDKDVPKRSVIIAAGRLTGQKNHEILIKAFKIVREDFPAYLVILGEGELKGHLEDTVKRLGIKEYVDFAGFKKNPYPWMKEADIFVMSSDWEGFGNVLVEAMVCGTAVISTDCQSGPNEIIENGVNGILVPVNDRDALAKAILRLLEDRKAREGIKHRAFETAQKYDVTKIVPEYEEVFKIR
ncbi:MAG: glycosyltransferase [Candidatus Omnitrophica bacterium]|nr:glycosyltransferase [Candidatus Omnitrophota bacterium]